MGFYTLVLRQECHGSQVRFVAAEELSNLSRKSGLHPFGPEVRFREK